MAAPVVRTDQLTKDFATGLRGSTRHRALDGLTLDIPAGVVFGLLGPNGAGKSTTLKLLLDLLRPTSGSAQMLGRPPGDLDVRRRVGFLPEVPSFYDHLTGEELLEYFAGLFGYAGRDRDARVAGLLDRVGLDGDRRRPLRQYSKGMLQRLGLAQALVNDPEIVLLDEPMSGLDPMGRRLVREMILELRDQGRTVIFSSHILSDAERLCSRIGILAGGRLAASGTLADLTEAAGPRGAEIVVANLPPGVVEGLPRSVRRATRIDEGRYSLELEQGARPEPVVSALIAAGATLVAVTPLRMSLEDVFREAVEKAAIPPPARAPSSVIEERAPRHEQAGGGAAGRVRLVAWHVFKESVRDRVLYGIGAFALLLLAVSLVVGQLSAGEDIKIVKDLGLATVEIAGVLMAAFVGVGLVSREIDRRSIQSLLAKPLRRGEFIIGKYAGMVLTIVVNVAAMGAALYLVLALLHLQAMPVERQAWEAPALDPMICLALLMIAAELALLTGVALFFSTFSSSALLAGAFTLGVFVAGVLSADLRGFGDLLDVPAALARVVAVVGWILPAFSAFDVKAQVVHGLALPPGYVVLTLTYAAAYVLALLTAAVALFSRREFR
jgi:ABC-2 type transport system ATP-binding protein